MHKLKWSMFALNGFTCLTKHVQATWVNSTYRAVIGVSPDNTHPMLSQKRWDIGCLLWGNNPTIKLIDQSL